MAISAQLKEIYASGTAQRYVETLEFYHSLFPAKSYFMTNDTVAWDFFLEDGRLITFKQVPFRVVLPANDHGGNQDLSVTLANIGRDLVDPLEQAIMKPQEPIRCTYRVYIDQANTMPQNTPPLTLTISNVQVSQETVSATATRADVLNKSFPSKLYRYDDFPGLRR
jgi:hypothetical protein